jgi:alpha-1,6-mannosyltransferase
MFPFFSQTAIFSTTKTHHLFGCLLGLSFLSVVIFSQSSAPKNLDVFFILMAISYGLVFGFFGYLWWVKQELTAGFVMMWALVFHLMGILGAPLFEDDYFRYLWDAYHTMHYGSPYGVAPSEYFNLGDTQLNDRFQNILGQINYPEIPTIYGPSLQYSFLLAYLIAPGEVWALQLIYALVDLVLIYILLKLAPPRMVMLYAWSPLVFKEVILTAHPDGLGICLLIAAVWCTHKQHFYCAAVLLGASLAAKVFAILFVPFLLIKSKPRHWCVFLATLIVLYAPLLSNQQSDLLGLAAMAQDWQFNSAFYGLLTLWFVPHTAKLILALFVFLFLAGYAYIHCRPKFSLQRPWLTLNISNNIVRGDLIMGVFLLCAPVINPWYLLWVLPFAVIHFSISAWLASVMIVLAYVVGLNIEEPHLLGAYQMPVWVRPLEFGVIILVILSECYFQYCKRVLRDNLT